MSTREPIERPDLRALFTPIVKGQETHRFDELTWKRLDDQIEIARVPCKFVDGVSSGTFGFIARTKPLRKGNQGEQIAWVGNTRVKIAALINSPTLTVYHIGTGGPLFASRLAAVEEARRFLRLIPRPKQESLALPK